MSDWEQKRISDIANFENHRRVPLKGLDREKMQGSYPYYGASGVVDYINDCIFEGDFLLISEDGENLKSRKTPIAFKATGKFWVNNHAHILSEKENGGLEFLEYYFANLDLSPYLTGAVQPKLNKKSLDSIKINFPKQEIRLRINKILGDFDKKIQLNNETNQTLEQIAQAMFKSWFVDFDPVHVKASALAEGKSEAEATLHAMQSIAGKTAEQLAQYANTQPEDYAQLKTTAEAFPSGFDEAGIPEGWECVKIEDIVERLKNPKKLKKSDVHEKGKTLILEQGADIFMGFNDDEPAFNATVDNPIFIFGDHTCITHISTQPFSIYQNVIALTGRDLPTYWVYHAILGKQTFQEYRRHWKEFIIKEIVVPNDLGLCDIYSEKVKFMYKKKDYNFAENEALTNTRDTLLPRLLSGEVLL